MGYGLSPYTRPDGSPIYAAGVVVRGSLSSSRKINALGQYELEADGSFAAMPDTSQRVDLAIAFAEIDSDVIDPNNLALEEQRIAAALADMTSPKAAKIRVERIKVTSTQVGEVKRDVVYTRVGADESKTVKL